MPWQIRLYWTGSWSQRRRRWSRILGSRLSDGSFSIPLAWVCGIFPQVNRDPMGLPLTGSALGDDEYLVDSRREPPAIAANSISARQKNFCTHVRLVATYSPLNVHISPLRYHFKVKGDTGTEVLIAVEHIMSRIENSSNLSILGRSRNQRYYRALCDFDIFKRQPIIHRPELLERKHDRGDQLAQCDSGVRIAHMIPNIGLYESDAASFRRAHLRHWFHRLFGIILGGVG